MRAPDAHVGRRDARSHLEENSESEYEGALLAVVAGPLVACGLTGTFVHRQIKAIEELKEKTKRGERLEVTQLKKLDTEADIRRELDALLLSNPASLSAAA